VVGGTAIPEIRGNGDLLARYVVSLVAGRTNELRDIRGQRESVGVAELVYHQQEGSSPEKDEGVSGESAGQGRISHGVCDCSANQE